MSLLNPNAWNMVLNGYVEGYQPPIYLNNRSQVLNGDIGSGLGAEAICIPFSGSYG